MNMKNLPQMDMAEKINKGGEEMYDVLKVAGVLYLFKVFLSSLNLSSPIGQNQTTAILCIAVAVIGIVLPLILRRK